jgi:hypothetical protein
MTVVLFCCFVVSGDSDLVPPVKIIRKYFSDKKVIVAYPPKRKSSANAMASIRL